MDTYLKKAESLKKDRKTRSEINNKIGACYLELRNLIEAKISFKQALALNPNNQAAKTNLAKIENIEEDAKVLYNQAIDVLKERNFPVNAAYYYERGIIQLISNNLKAAESDFNEADKHRTLQDAISEADIKEGLKEASTPSELASFLKKNLHDITFPPNLANLKNDIFKSSTPLLKN